MSIVLITGDHPRHRYLARQVMACGLPVTWFAEQREHFTPPPPAHLNRHLATLWQRHFSLRDECEHSYFSQHGAPLDAAIPITSAQLNADDLISHLRQLQPRLLLSYGCHKLSPALLSCFDGMAWNVHGGLSPWYRGCITHFWPSYLLEPQMTGMTLHTTTEAIDGGDILYQSAVTPRRGDRLHDLACRAVREFSDALPEVLDTLLASGQPVAGIRPASSGRIWTARMWQPQHLELIYGQMEDKIVDYCLDSGVAMPAAKLLCVESLAPLLSSRHAPATLSN